ncbi:TIGR03086 family metal-binding protein [Nostocoides sp. HKS02]|uniref:TIGR03086 family metal-binding protein n=1 Tax=Nostocoides sp. HKS02 TaxID=1813880 RepID=UPI0018A7FE3B|nr:TIGR03086 family metal-binding protein [Tetrasphaera sp. HKS02]
MPSVPDCAPPGAVELLERAVAYAQSNLRLVTADDLERPTPCTRWRLGELLWHLDDSLAAMGEAAQTSSLTLVPTLAPVAGLDLVESIGQRTRGLLGHWHPPRGGGVAMGLRHLPREVVGAVGALEITLHAWDVGQALGSRRPIPPGLAADLWPVARRHITAADRPRRFASALTVQAGAGPADRLLAHAGRHG